MKIAVVMTCNFDQNFGGVKLFNHNQGAFAFAYIEHLFNKYYVEPYDDGDEDIFDDNGCLCDMIDYYAKITYKNGNYMEFRVLEVTDDLENIIDEME